MRYLTMLESKLEPFGRVFARIRARPVKRRREAGGPNPPPAVLPPPGKFDFGQFRKGKPFSTAWGFDRGTPIDRYYIEAFLDRHSPDIIGRVVEIKDNTYTEQFGKHFVTESYVLDNS